jgi:hypothetical protein
MVCCDGLGFGFNAGIRGPSKLPLDEAFDSTVVDRAKEKCND